ncbi:MAG: 50S ribosomal protein L30 [Acholeplasmatales bacterium]|jgi:large subunit ribosomal protein L30|nr:50S ribosomal protein L30 [Acholeplasmatales bacterium]
MAVSVKLVKSLIGRKPNQIKTAHALGLHRVNQIVVKELNDSVQGQIDTIKHLVTVSELKGE